MSVFWGFMRAHAGLTRKTQDTNELFNTGGHLPMPAVGGNHLVLPRSGEPQFLVQTNWDAWNNQTTWGCAAVMANYRCVAAGVSCLRHSCGERRASRRK